MRDSCGDPGLLLWAPKDAPPKRCSYPQLVPCADHLVTGGGGSYGAGRPRKCSMSRCTWPRHEARVGGSGSGSSSTMMTSLADKPGHGTSLPQLVCTCLPGTTLLCSWLASKVPQTPRCVAGRLQAREACWRARGEEGGGRRTRTSFPPQHPDPCRRAAATGNGTRAACSAGAGHPLQPSSPPPPDRTCSRVGSAGGGGVSGRPGKGQPGGSPGPAPPVDQAASSSAGPAAKLPGRERCWLAAPVRPAAAELGVQGWDKPQGRAPALAWR